jgi:hypothetical protein
MFLLHNDQLEIQIIDPLKDRKLLGSRYCTGGYIYQVSDLKKGNLFSGPQYPNPDFDVFNGQGAPEVFLLALNQEQCEIGQEVYVLGVGSVTRTSPTTPFHVRDNPVVKEFCIWKIEEKKDYLKMVSKSVFNQWDFVITKIITLNYRTVSSQTIISNKSKENLPIIWFAHPFFPIPENGISCKFSPRIKLVGNEGYFINDEGFFELKKAYNWKKGLYQKIAYNSKRKLSVIQCHPLVGKVSISCDFIPESIAIWANDITFSFEPFYKGNVESCKESVWNISYCF